MLHGPAALLGRTAAGNRCGLAMHGDCSFFPISFLAFARRIASQPGVLGGQPRCKRQPEQVASQMFLGYRAVMSSGNGN